MPSSRKRVPVTIYTTVELCAADIHEQFHYGFKALANSAKQDAAVHLVHVAGGEIGNGRAPRRRFVHCEEVLCRLESRDGQERWS